MAGKIRRIIRYVINTISVLIVILAVFILVNVLFASKGNIPDIMGYSMLRVLTGSMKPEMPEGTLLVVKHLDAEEVQEGDVISFYSADPSLDGMVNTHRITRIEQKDDSYIIYTKGDANKSEDAYPTDEKHLIGKVIWKNYMLGSLVRLISNPLIFVPIIIAPLVLILLYHFRQIIHTTRELSKEQEKAYQEALTKLIEKKKRDREHRDK